MNILLADDHPIFRKGLRFLIEDNYKDCTITEVNNGKEAIDALKHDSFMFSIIDIDMPELSGIDVLHFIKDNDISTKPIILTMHNDELFFNESFNNGAIGFLLKEDSSLEIVDCIESVKVGIPFLSERIKPYLENRKEFNSKTDLIRTALKSLSKSEFNTLKLVAENKTSKQIAGLLFMTEKSIENYRSRICKKLKINGGSNSLFKWCLENKNYIATI